MKRVDLRVVAYLSVVALVAAVSGCEEQPTLGLRSPTTRTIGKLGPEESFELIVETFRRGVEDVPIGFRMTREGGHSRMSGRNEVKHELIRPAKDGDPYKGIIIVESESHYSIQRQTDRHEEPQPKEKSDKEDVQSILDASGEPSGTEILDSALVGTAGAGEQNSRPQLPIGDNIVARRPDQLERKYDLIYANGRWELVTKLDKDTEQSIENAFQHALQTQI
jgi:hypothetical protein